MLHPLFGHAAQRRAILAAHARGRLPSVLLLHGPQGVGKQRFALWLGQRLACEAPLLEEPCGSCRGCRQALRLEHPDVHWYVPVVKPKAKGSQERDDEALEDVRRAWIEEVRDTPLQPSYSNEVRGLHFGTIRNLRRQAFRGGTNEGRRLIIIGEAEELAAQESSQQAANALLKLLEEPPEGLHFVLTTNEPGRVLATIRSRAMPFHLPALPETEVRSFLEQSAGASSEHAEKAARLSSGSIGRGLAFLPVGDDEGPLEQVRRAAFHTLRAALAVDGTLFWQEALAQRASGARGLGEHLSAVELWIRDLGFAAAGLEASILNREAAPWLMKEAARLGLDPGRTLRAQGAVASAREAAAGNVNPQLLIAGLLAGVRDTLTGPG
jgi:DNA polymerase III delta prime subunit